MKVMIRLYSDDVRKKKKGGANNDLSKKKRRKDTQMRQYFHPRNRVSEGGK